MSFQKEIMKGVSETIVLQVLHSEAKAYGYQLSAAIRDASDGAFEFQEGTLYPLLYRLEVKGLVKSEKQNAPSGKERRYYSLTPSGKKALKEQTAQLKQFQHGLQRLFSV